MLFQVQVSPWDLRFSTRRLLNKDEIQILRYARMS
jgi:hypothetical protein